MNSNTQISNSKNVELIDIARIYSGFLSRTVKFLNYDGTDEQDGL